MKLFFLRFPVVFVEDLVDQSPLLRLTSIHVPVAFRLFRNLLDRTPRVLGKDPIQRLLILQHFFGLDPDVLGLAGNSAVRLVQA